MSQSVPLRARLIVVTLAACAFSAGALAAGEAANPPATDPTAAAVKAASQQAFATADALFQALADAAKANDAIALVALLGPDGNALVNSGDRVADKQAADRFAAAYAEKHAITMEDDAKATLVLGKDDWPMPIPAVKGPRGWTFDTREGAREILARRIGRNELDAIEVVRAVVDAEHEYSGEDRDADGLRSYAAKFISTAGSRDGLYWPTKTGEPPSPLGPLIGTATAEGYKGKQGSSAPYHGYRYRLLAAQGKDAPGGARDYLVGGRMIGGFAVLAYPASYGNSGIMSFMANQDGVVYQKDLGPATASRARDMRTYNPDPSWTAVK